MSVSMQQIATDAPQLDANDLVTAKHMADTLHRHYPGHLWAVTCDGSKGVATIRNLMLSGNMGYTLHLPRIYSASEWDKRVLMAGGEILERYRVMRASLDRAHSQIMTLPTDFAGRIAVERD
ncbi:hypothetical protein [Pseudothauera rhizosphaerae]|uniref:Uncharacterized protein n=1 Tax=Pseudothauera rhizosphaerae TaxID=2565932 RepID=A0A4S4AAI5_9RHOO|nr:hypothetical protein [Pseudothauera rhizosphaerae]THF55925.1 hypothetical protein E6O51_20275 [Pseudothauera rhizosphaerae]